MYFNLNNMDYDNLNLNYIQIFSFFHMTIDITKYDKCQPTK
jgi:hypothetical protein